MRYPDQSIVQFIPGTNIEFTVEKYNEDLYLCNLSIVDSLKVIGDNKVTIHGNLDQTISDQLTHKFLSGNKIFKFEIEILFRNKIFKCEIEIFI